MIQTRICNEYHLHSSTGISPWPPPKRSRGLTLGGWGFSLRDTTTSEPTFNGRDGRWALEGGVSPLENRRNKNNGPKNRDCSRGSLWWSHPFLANFVSFREGKRSIFFTPHIGMEGWREVASIQLLMVISWSSPIWVGFKKARIPKRVGIVILKKSNLRCLKDGEETIWNIFLLLLLRFVNKSKLVQQCLSWTVFHRKLHHTIQLEGLWNRENLPAW